MTTYPHERQIEYWVSRAIEDYFENQGYDIVVLPNSNRAEKIIPYDHLFAGRGVKVFGLQYKRLHKAKTDYWLIDIAQLHRLTNFDWIYYVLPEIKSIRQHRNALHLVAISKPKLIDKNIGNISSISHQLPQSALGIGINKIPYYRWGGFIQKLFSCSEGWRPSSVDELRSFLSDYAIPQDISGALTDIYMVPLDTRDSTTAIRLSPFISEAQGGELDYDFGNLLDDQ
jgi:hypothetical protein